MITFLFIAAMTVIWILVTLLVVIWPGAVRTSDEDPTPYTRDKDLEISYWKNRCSELKDEYKELQNDYDELLDEYNELEADSVVFPDTPDCSCGDEDEDEEQ